MDLTSRIIWHVEMRLREPMDLARLSELCAASPYHLARTFQTATGIAPIAYLRARRLSEAARALGRGETDILSLALSLDYASHEAFTRAFVRHFERTPSDVRADGSYETLNLMEPLRMKRDMIVDLAAPELKPHRGMRVVGLNLECQYGKTEGIPGLWQQINARGGEIEGGIDGAAYGVCYGSDGAGSFQYLAGFEAKEGYPVPEGMTEVSVEERDYAVFTHDGHISDFPKTVYTIWNKGLSDAGLTPVRAPDFERYDASFDPMTGQGRVQVWIPVEKV